MIAGAVALTAALATPNARAVAVLEFDDARIFGGTLSYSGDPGASLVGTNIIFDTIIGTGTPANTGVLLTIVGGDLDFSTGGNTSESPGLYTFAGGGTFVLSGTALGPGNVVVAAGTLLTGSFSGVSTVLGLGGGNGLFSGLGIDTKNVNLLAFYGIAAGTNFTFANTEIGVAPLGLEADGGFVANVLNADLTNTEVTPRAVPEGGSAIALLGFALLGLEALRRKLGIALA
jgi:VPDSG-CTERM motif